MKLSKIFSIENTIKAAALTIAAGSGYLFTPTSIWGTDARTTIVTDIDEIKASITPPNRNSNFDIEYASPLIADGSDYVSAINYKHFIFACNSSRSPEIIEQIDKKYLSEEALSLRAHYSKIENPTAADAFNYVNGAHTLATRATADISAYKGSFELSATTFPAKDMVDAATSILINIEHMYDPIQKDDVFETVARERDECWNKNVESGIQYAAETIAVLNTTLILKAEASPIARIFKDNWAFAYQASEETGIDVHLDGGRISDLRRHLLP